MSSESAAREYSYRTMSRIVKVKYVWAIENFPKCFSMDGDKRMSSVFSICGNDSHFFLVLRRYSAHYFIVEIEPAVNETYATTSYRKQSLPRKSVDNLKTFQQLRVDTKICVRNIKDEEVCLFTGTVLTTFIHQIGGYLDSKCFYDNVKDDCLTLFFEFSVLNDMGNIGKEICTSDLRRKHQESMKFLAENTSHADVVLVSAEKEELHAHKCILAAHSRVFAAMFELNMRERNEGRVSIDDISSTILKKMLAFMYTGEAPDLRDADDAVWLLDASAKYEIDVLKEFCADSMPEPTVENVCEMLALTHLHDVQKLKVRAAAFINQHSDAVMKTQGWRELYKTPALVQFVISQK